MIDASQQKGFSVKQIKTEELPENMKKMTLAERMKYIELNAKKRSLIQTQINELNTKRQKYIAENKKEETGDKMLDNAMISAIKKQAKAKNFKF